jgi:hypothetical protein
VPRQLKATQRTVLLGYLYLLDPAPVVDANSLGVTPAAKGANPGKWRWPGCLLLKFGAPNTRFPPPIRDREQRPHLRQAGGQVTGYENRTLSTAPELCSTGRACQE